LRSTSRGTLEKVGLITLLLNQGIQFCQWMFAPKITMVNFLHDTGTFIPPDNCFNFSSVRMDLSSQSRIAGKLLTMFSLIHIDPRSNLADSFPRQSFV
jgi:hypothetical protein